MPEAGVGGGAQPGAKGGFFARLLSSNTGRIGLGVDDLLNQSIPFPAVRAFTQPFGCLGAAFCTNVNGFEFHIGSPFDSKL
jgi:hypothetical protein